MKKNKDFMLAKTYFLFLRLVGFIVSGYLLIESLQQIMASLEKERTFAAAIFAVLSIIFLYLAFKMVAQGYQAAKAKRIQDLP